MLPLPQIEFEGLLKNLGEALKSQYSLPLKDGKLRDLVARQLGFADYNTYKGLQAQNAPVLKTLQECIQEAAFCRLTVKGEGEMLHVSYTEDEVDEDGDWGIGGFTLYLDPVNGRECAVIYTQAELGDFSHRRDNVWVGPSGELLELFNLSLVTPTT